MQRIHWLDPMDPRGFPPTSEALEEPNGLLAAGGDLSVERLLAAYRRGIFPWYSPGQPILWWSPDPRTVLFPAQLRVTRSLRKRAQNAGFTVTLDQAFTAVMRGCAAPRDGQPGTWISEDMVAAYQRLFQAGYAHSVEVWDGEELVGGLYGVATGRIFFGESMFSRRADTSKIALLWLTRQLEAWGFSLIDCQVASNHLFSLGAQELPRQEFLLRLQHAASYPNRLGPWRFDPDFEPLSPPRSSTENAHG